ncbi:MAG: BrnT family toxin [Candidatus Omnitrophota bacterium]
MVYYQRMEFEYDVEKARTNKEKHGVDFEEAKKIWHNDFLMAPALSDGEHRYMIIGKIKESLYSCIFTVRGERIRIISCRKSRDKEKRGYYEKIK